MSGSVLAPGKNLTVDLGNAVALDLILISPGSFMMGSDINDEKPIHQVTISKPFYIGKCEVTQKQWEAVMGSNPSQFPAADNPVENVSWEDCRIFLHKLGEKVCGKTFALPTEAQWEYACRAGGTGKYCFGDDPAELREYAWFGENAGRTTHPVGQKKPNAWGLHDVHGSLWEWCADWYGEYAEGQATDPKGPASGPGRILRGGAWGVGPGNCRAARRINSTPDTRANYTGVRVVL